MSNIGTRPDFKTLKLVPQSSDPVNPSAGEIFFSDGTSRPRGEYYYDGSQWNAITPSSGGYISNPNALASVSPYITYADSAGPQPTDGTGGSPVVTLTRDTTSKVIGVTSFKLAKDAVNRQGQGASVNFSIDQALTNKLLNVSFRYQTSGSFTNGSIDGITPSDVTVYIYDVTNAILIPLFPNTLLGDGVFQSQFQASSSTSYRLIFHIGTTNPSAYDLYFGDVNVSELDYTFIQSNTDWISYTPTFAGLGTVSNVNIRYRKDGPDLVLEGKFSAGTVSGSTATMTLPAGLLADSSYLTSPGYQVVGEAGTSGVSTTYFGALTLLASPSSNTINWGRGSSTTNPEEIRTGSALVGNNERISFKARVRIQGWTSGATTLGQIFQNVPSLATYTTTAGQSVPSSDTIIDFGTKVEDKLGEVTTGASWKFTAKQSGVYSVKAQLRWATAQTSAPYQMKLYKNGSYFRELAAITLSATGSSVAGLSGSTDIPLNPGDYIDIRAYQGSGGSTSLSTGAGQNNISITKNVDASAFLNIPKVAYVKNVIASGTNGGSTTTGSYNTRPLNTVEDTYGIVTLSSNQFTLQPGTYDIRAIGDIYLSNKNKHRIQNITAGSTALLGISGYANSTNGYSQGEVSGIIQISVASVFEFQYRVETARTTDGLGVDSTFGDNNTFALIRIQKLL